MKEVEPTKKQRKRYRSIENTTQTRITNYFWVVDQDHQLIRKNQELKTCLDNCILENQRLDQNKNCKVAYSSLLDILSKAAVTNSSRLGKGKRYDVTIHLFASYLFMLDGRLLYETLYKKLPLPSPTSIGRYPKEYGPIVIEG